jgi:hypothetical protein
MAKDNLETRAEKAILYIQGKVTDIYDVLRDLSLKLCHWIQSDRDYYRHYDRNDYRR